MTMMERLIERVGSLRVIVPIRVGDRELGEVATVEAHIQLTPAFCRQVALAILTELREPTESMTDDVYEPSCRQEGEPGVSRAQAVEIFTGMIAAVIGERA